MSNVTEDLSILVVGYDGYVDVWIHFFKLLNHFWADRPSTFLATSELTPTFNNVQSVPAGKNTEWSKKASIALNTIKSRYVLLMLEDFFISDYVKNSEINSIIDLMKSNGVLYYQLTIQLVNPKLEKGKKYQKNKDVRIIPTNKKYPINLQAAIWEKNYLQKTIGDGNYNAWQFEINNISMPTLNKDKVMYLFDRRNVLHVTHAVVQSKYLPSAVRKMKRIGFDINLDNRAIMNKKDSFKYNLKLFVYSFSPRFLLKFFKAVGKLFGADYVTDRVKKQD